MRHEPCFSPTRLPTLGARDSGAATGLLMPISTSNCCRMPAAFSLRAVRSRSMPLVSIEPVATSTAAFDSATSCLICSRNLSAVDATP